jgi:hypothetical protein
MIRFTGKNIGTDNKTVTVTSTGASTSLYYKVIVNRTHIDSSNLQLNANVWAYFSSPLLKNRESSALAGSSISPH